MRNLEHEKLLELRNIRKTFPGVVANDDVSFNVRPGEVHALLGENGAGKTTLMNVLYGLYPRDRGEIWWQGQPVDIHAPRDAIRLGIGMIHQHFMLVPKFTVVENIVLGQNGGLNPALDLKAPAEKTIALSKRYGLSVDPWARVSELSVGYQQRVEILKALYHGSQLLIMDEPTAVLTPAESEQLFDVLHQLRAENRSVVFISHKLNEVLQISDRITVLRDGQHVGTVTNHGELKRSDLARMMVGRPVTLKVEKEPARAGDVLLRVENVYTADKLRRENLRGLSLVVRRGEILGIAGVDGNGQGTLSAVIMGLQEVSEGKIEMFGTEMTGRTTQQIRKLPVAYIPEDRQRTGLVLAFPVRDNVALSDIGQAPFGSWWRIKTAALLEYARKQIARFRIATPDPMTQVGKLSGGNQQKVVLAREVGENAELIIANQPTRGLDIDATRFVFEVMLQARQKGAAVLYISTELEEIMALSDRVGVIYEGRLMGIVPAEETDIELIGLWMAGERSSTKDVSQRPTSQSGKDANLGRP